MIKFSKNNIIIFLGIIFTILLLPRISWGATYYVDGSCSSSGNGTTAVCGANGPWKTLTEANTGVPNNANHTIIVAPGTYTENISDTRNGVAPGFRHWLAGGTVNINGHFYLQGNYQKLEGFTLSEQNPNTTSYYGVIIVTKTGTQVLNNTIQNSTHLGISTWVGSSYATVSGNTIKTVIQTGMNIFGDNHLIENNDISDIRWSYLGSTLTGDANGLDIGYPTTGIVVRRNYIHDIFFGDGLPHIDGIQKNFATSSTGTIIEQNRVYFPQEAKSGAVSSYGMMLSGASDWIIRNNIFETWGGINTGNSGINQNMKIYNNIFRSDISWVNRYWGGGVQLRGGSGHEIKNNILVNFRSVGRDAAFIYLSEGATATGTNNLFWNSDGTALKFDGYTPDATDKVGVDPKFVVNYTDLHLQSTSPAINAGAAVSSVTNDYDSNSRPQGAGLDIGAYEYVGAVPPDTTPPAAPTGVAVN